MELRVFVKETLKDILGGVKDAQQEIKEGEIVPVLNEQAIKQLTLKFQLMQWNKKEVKRN